MVIAAKTCDHVKAGAISWGCIALECSLPSLHAFQVPTGSVTEVSGSEKLEEFRRSAYTRIYFFSLQK